MEIKSTDLNSQKGYEKYQRELRIKRKNGKFYTAPKIEPCTFEEMLEAVQRGNDLIKSVGR